MFRGVASCGYSVDQVVWSRVLNRFSSAAASVVQPVFCLPKLESLVHGRSRRLLKLLRCPAAMALPAVVTQWCSAGLESIRPVHALTGMKLAQEVCHLQSNCLATMGCGASSAHGPLQSFLACAYCNSFLYSWVSSTLGACFQVRNLLMSHTKMRRIPKLLCRPSTSK